SVPARSHRGRVRPRLPGRERRGRPGPGRGGEIRAHARRRMIQILVVDDEAAIREVLIEFLSGHGYAVQGAADGREGIRMAKSLKPQVVLLDIAMPGMNGIETLKR